MAARTPATELNVLTCEVWQARVEHPGPSQPLELHVLEVLLVSRGAWAATASLSTAPCCRLQRMERRSSTQKVVVMVVRVAINSVMIQVILVMIGSKERSSYCR